MNEPTISLYPRTWQVELQPKRFKLETVSFRRFSFTINVGLRNVSLMHSRMGTGLGMGMEITGSVGDGDRAEGMGTAVTRTGWGQEPRRWSEMGIVYTVPVQLSTR